jgi:hypothetical protein
MDAWLDVDKDGGRRGSHCYCNRCADKLLPEQRDYMSSTDIMRVLCGETLCRG